MVRDRRDGTWNGLPACSFLHGKGSALEGMLRFLMSKKF